MRCVGMLVAAAALLTATAAGAVTVDRAFHETFEAREGDRIVCRFGDGDLRVVPSEDGMIDVRIRYHMEVRGFGIGGEPGFEAEIRRDGSDIIIAGHETYYDGGLVIVHRLHEYTYTVSAPPEVVLQLSGDDGDVSVRDWRATIDCAVDDGDVRLTGVEAERADVSLNDGDLEISDHVGDIGVAGDDGDVLLSHCAYTSARIHLDDGDVDAADCDGRFELHLDDGDVSLFGMSGEIIELRGDDGDVRLELVGAGAVDVNTELDDGDIDLLLAPGLSAEVRITTDDGIIDVESGGLTDYEESEHFAGGMIGDGAGRIRVTTDDGDISVRQGDERRR